MPDTWYPGMLVILCPVLGGKDPTFVITKRGEAGWPLLHSQGPDVDWFPSWAVGV
jgi:hypothetical protein